MITIIVIRIIGILITIITYTTAISVTVIFVQV